MGSTRRYDDDRYERRQPDPDSRHRRVAEEGRLRRSRYSDSKDEGSPPRRSDRDDDHRRHRDGRESDVKMKGSPRRTDRDGDRRHRERERRSDSSEDGESPPRHGGRGRGLKRRYGSRENNGKSREDSPRPLTRDKERQQREPSRSSPEPGEASPLRKPTDQRGDHRQQSDGRDSIRKPIEDNPSRDRGKERGSPERSRSSSESGEASPPRKSMDKQGAHRQHSDGRDNRKSPPRKSTDHHGEHRHQSDGRDNISKPIEDDSSRERGKGRGRRERSRSSTESGEASPPRNLMDKEGDRRQHSDGRDNISRTEDGSRYQVRDSRSSIESGEVSPPRKSNDIQGDRRQQTDSRGNISKPREDGPSQPEIEKNRVPREPSRSSIESGEASPPRKSIMDRHGDHRRHMNVRDTVRKPREDSPSRRDGDKGRGLRGHERSSSHSDEDNPPRRSRGKVNHRRRGRSRNSSESDSSPRRSKGKTSRRRRERAISSSDSGDSLPRRSKGKEDHGRHRDREERLRRDEKVKPNGEAKTTTREGGTAANPPESNEQLPPPPPLPDMGRSGGVYIPPFKLARMMREVQDKSGEAYQRMSWDALRKSINGLVNKVNATNIKNIIPELFAENLIRGRGLFCRSCMKSQMASPGFTDVFSALVAVVNTKFPDVGKLLLNRIVLQLKRAYKRNDKPQLLAATKFIAHLVNQQVAHEIISLELLTVLLEKPTDDSVEVAVGFIKECGSLLQDLSPQGLHGIFERFRGILHEGEIDKRVQFLIEGLFAIRKAKFEGFPAVRPELDLVDVEDQFTHEVSLEDAIDPETTLDIFKPNPQFLEDEKAYEDLKINILGDESSEDEGESDEEGDDDDEDDDDEDEEESEDMRIRDETETNLINLRRTIYLTIMSSVDFEEAGHKLLKIKLEPGQEMELCIMLLECCSQERTYLRYYGLLGQRFCLINKVHQENFEKCFVQQYSMIHRLETNKLRNVAKFFAHLLGTDALPWHVLAYIRLTEEDTTSSSRIFIKILFQELSEHLGIRLLNERLNEPTMQDSFESIFPKDNPKNTRFAINFFTSIGLGGITESLREYLRNMPRLIMQQQKAASSDDDSGSSGSSSSGSDSGTSSESDSSSGSESDSDSESEKRRKRRKR